jgi:LemA protein
MANWIVLGVGAVLFFWVVGQYNGLVRMRNQLKNAFAQIDVQLKRRYDLIPNLVESVKGIMAHERQTLEAVIAARNSAQTASLKASADPSNAGAMKQLIQAEGVLGANMGRFMALMESYPDIKSGANMNTLMEELASTENKVAFSRQGYNDSVMTYNTARESFPASLVAGALGFHHAELFEITNPQERQGVQVKFS